MTGTSSTWVHSSRVRPSACGRRAVSGHRRIGLGIGSCANLGVAGQMYTDVVEHPVSAEVAAAPVLDSVDHRPERCRVEPAVPVRGELGGPGPVGQLTERTGP